MQLLVGFHTGTNDCKEDAHLFQSIFMLLVRFLNSSDPSHSHTLLLTMSTYSHLIPLLYHIFLFLYKYDFSYLSDSNEQWINVNGLLVDHTIQSWEMIIKADSLYNHSQWKSMCRLIRVLKINRKKSTMDIAGCITVGLFKFSCKKEKGIFYEAARWLALSMELLQYHPCYDSWFVWIIPDYAAS